MNSIKEALENSPERYALNFEFENEGLRINFIDKIKKNTLDFKVDYIYSAIAIYLAGLNTETDVYELDRARILARAEALKKLAEELEKDAVNAVGTELYEAHEKSVENYNKLINEE